MSPSSIGLLFILIVPLQNVDGTGNKKNGGIRNTDIDNIMVSFWEYQTPPRPLKLICLGILIRSNRIFLTTHCAGEVKRVGTNTAIEYGGYAAKEILPEFINMDCIKEVHPLSRFSIVFLRENYLLPSSLKLDCVNPYLQENKPINGKLVGWDQKLGRPETEDVKFYFYPLIQLNEEIEPCKIPIFPEGSILVEDRHIIALVDDIEDKKNMFNQISFADKLLVEDLLETENGANGEETSQVVAGQDENVNIRKIDYYNIIVSFWRSLDKLHPSELICLGILIRSNWIFLTTNCANNLEPLEDIVIEYGGYTIHNFKLKGSRILKKATIYSLSKFTIVHLNHSYPLQSSFKLDYANPSLHEKDRVHAKVVGWSTRANRPEVMEVQISIGVLISLKKPNRKALKSNFPDGSILVEDTRIIALVNQKSEIGNVFYKIPFDDKLRVETKLEMEDDKISGAERIKISQEDYKNVIVTFYKKADSEQKEILCLGFLVRPDWAFVTIHGYTKLKPFSGTIAVTRRDSSKSNLSGIHILRSESYFIIVALDCHTGLRSSLKIFPTDHIEDDRMEGKFFGWNSSGVMQLDEVFNYKPSTRLMVEDSANARMSNFPEGSHVMRGRKIIAVSHMDDKIIKFYKILYKDYLNVESLLQKATKIRIETEDSDSVLKYLHHGSASTSAGRKRNVACNKGEASSKAAKNLLIE